MTWRGSGWSGVRAVGGGAVLAALLLVSAAGCASGGTSAGGDADASYGAATPEGAISEFLDAAREDDYGGMIDLFGTADGPAAEDMSRSELEQRMLVLAALLEHRSYEIRRSNLSEGPNRTRYTVDMTGTRSGDVTVPIIVASWDGRYLVEQIHTDPLTEGTGY